MYYVCSPPSKEHVRMKAALLTEPERIRIDELPAPTPSDGEVLVAPRSLGVCGTDRKIFSGTIPVAYPRILGHEIVGEVVAAGGDLANGTRVIVDPSITCGRCARCLEGRGNICEAGGLLGRDRDGGFRQAIAVPRRYLHVLPTEVTDDVAPLVQVLTTCVHGQRRVGIFPGDAVAIVGMGVTGLLHLQLAKLRGAWPVVCVTRSERKLELARELGADETVVADDRAGDRVRALTGGGPDVTIECAGLVATLAASVRLARPGGRILAYGTIAATDGSFPFYDLYHKELTIENARSAGPQDYPVAIDATASGRIRLDGLVTHRFSLDETAEAFRTESASDALKVIVRV
jgi:L-iditol 2-dehydrogenase